MDAKPPDGTEAVEKKSDETVGSNASTIVNIEEDITAVTITENVENIRSVSRKEPRIVDLTLSRNNLEDDVIVKPEPKVYINLGNFENEEEEKRTRWEPIHAYYSYGQPGQYPGGGGGYWGGQQQPYQAPPYQAPPYQAPPYQAQSSPAPQYDQHHGYQSGGPHMWGAPTEQYFEYDPKSRNRYVKMIFLITFLALLYVTVFSIATRYFSVTHRFLRSILGFGIFIMAMIAVVVVDYSIMCCAYCRRSPCSWIALVVSTLAMSYVVAFITIKYNTPILMVAMAITAGIVLICIGLACTSFDFTRFYLYFVLAGLAVGLLVIVFMVLRMFGIYYKPVHIALTVIVTLIQVINLESRRDPDCCCKLQHLLYKRLDTREGVTSHWSDPSTLGARATFRSDTRPAVLVLTKLRPEDSGQYRCRVDFIKSPTKNTRLNLTVLIPPERLIVLDQDGNEIHGGIIGPYDEGSEVNLTCIAVGGRPTARVSWWKAHALLANSEARATASFRLQRSDLSTDITCQAVTDPSITPVSEALTIDVNLRPLWVRLQGGKRPLVAGQSTELVCQAVGARPKPVISWWKGGNKLKTVRETISTDGNITSSILTFVPAIEDAGRVISCRAVQPSIPHSTHEDGWKMEIQHLPVVKLELGANLDASKVVEGSDVYLDCRVRANPWHNHIYFSHNGVTVKAGPGVLLANQSLVLQKVSRKAAGAYVCTARNSLGEGSSERLVLDVKYTPTCKSTQPTVLRAARGEVIEIECDLDANPRETMSFSWWFNSSAHSKHELTTSTMNAAHNIQGTFLYMVNTSSDYGWVQCAGTNSVGRQIKPCLFHILPADKPSSVKACEITNVTYDSLTLNCTPGHDGGIRQFFLLQVFDMGTGLLLRNVSSEDPEFEVTGLSTTNPLSVSVRAYNRKGSSEPLTLTSMLLKFPERHTAQVPVRVELTTVLIVVLISVGVIAAMTAVSAAIFCCRYCNKRDNKNEKDKRQQDETSNIPLTGTKESESVDSLDKNPDIIPLDGKISDSCSNKSSTTDYSSIRPLISKNQSDKYDHPPNCDRYYDHNIDQCNQYIQIRPVEYRVRPNYQPNMQMTNLGPSIQSIGPMTSMGMMGECQRQPYDKVYEDWLKYKNALPLNTSGLLPAEQLMPPELYATPPPPSIYSNPSRNPLNLAQMPELDRYHLEPRSLMAQDSRSCSNSPPVRFNTDNTVYFSKTMLERPTNTLPHLKPRINGNQELKPSATKAIDTNIEQMKVSKECG